ncbi:MAG: sarcosine oxidase subunit delta [Lysobacterales bacterium]|jgi:sarcosine oxidase subunit delta
MLRIECPYCGVRDQVEFQCGGEVNIVRPAEPDAASDAEWADYLFYRDNLKGRHLERWVHSFGCRQWFLLERDTVTHEILSSKRLAPSVPSDGGDN